MIETIYMIEPWHWLVLGFLLLIAEIFIPTFASLWFGAAAIIVAALAWLLPVPILLQVLIWLTLSVIFMFAWVKYIKPLSVDRTKAGLGGSIIIGETGMIVLKPQGTALGVVRFSVPIVGADEWSCRTQGEVVEVGDRVVVTDIVGNELIVALTKRIAVANVLQPDISVAIESRPVTSDIRINRLNLSKPNLDSVRLEKKFTNK